jgi:hypothetical protein
MNKHEGKYVIVRCDRAGVFAGILKDRTGQEVTLTDCRRLWYWDGAASISQLAVTGTVKPQRCQFTMTVAEITLLDAIEIIPCTEQAEKSIRGVGVWQI